MYPQIDLKITHKIDQKLPDYYPPDCVHNQNLDINSTDQIVSSTVHPILTSVGANPTSIHSYVTQAHMKTSHSKWDHKHPNYTPKQYFLQTLQEALWFLYNVLEDCNNLAHEQ